MNPIVRLAISHVRRANDFTLLDCLELLDRRRNGEDGALATVRFGGHTLIGYGDAQDPTCDDVDCPACEGYGELDADGANGKTYTVSCPACSGDGKVSAKDAVAEGDVGPFEDMAWKNLNDEPVNYEYSVHNFGKPIDFYKATEIVKKAQLEIEE